MRKAVYAALMGLVLLLAACTPSPDFTISLDPTSLAVQQGKSRQTILTLTPQNDFTGTVSLSLKDKNGNDPSGITLSPASVTVSGSDPVTQVLTLSVDRSVAAGVYALRVKATSGRLVKTADLSLTVTELPPPGGDIVVFNDVNVFDNTAMQNPNNVLMVKNLVTYTASGPRNAGTKVLFDRGRNSKCWATSECDDADLATMRSVIQGEGFTIEELNSTQGSITNLAPEVKVVFLWNPQETFTNAEINVFKKFASEGGRLVFIGEHQNYYDAITLENDFLGKMGAVMTNTGEAVDCAYYDENGQMVYPTLPQTSLRPHQITQGMTNVTIACSSVLVPGPNDYPLYYDSTNTKVLSAVATIDLTPLPLDYVAPAQLKTRAVPPPEPGLNPNSSTGR